jgi:hypothetical protein
MQYYRQRFARQLLKYLHNRFQLQFPAQVRQLTLMYYLTMRKAHQSTQKVLMWAQPLNNCILRQVLDHRQSLLCSRKKLFRHQVQ